MMTRRLGTPAVLFAALLLAGCAGSGASTPVGGAPGSSAVRVDPADPVGKTAPVPGPSDPVSIEPAPIDPSAGAGGKPGAKGAQTLSGTVSAGVEPRCLMLRGVDGVHQLIIADGAARDIAKVGASVTVVGRTEPRMMTTCQQGTPFVVSQVRAN